MNDWPLVALIVVAVASLAGLSLSAGKFVGNAARISKSFHVSPVVVGVVLMGFGTSLPELFVSAQAVLSGSPELALGNIVGSNTVNLSLVLGVGAVFTTLYVTSMTVRREALFGLISTGLYGFVMLFVASGVIRFVGAAALLGFGAFAIWEQFNRHHRTPAEEEPDDFVIEVEEELDKLPAKSNAYLIVTSVIFLVGLVASAQFLVMSAEGVALRIGLSELVIGVLLLALGTSLPELASVIVSARNGEHELIAGNLWGSTLFNSALVGGVSVLLGPGPQVNWWVVGIPVLVALFAWAATANGLKIVRWEGIVLVGVGFVATAALLIT
jgi:cation:H+ antiporter